jgi:hypothetical protein
VKKPHRRVMKNYVLRDELIGKGLITPVHLVPTMLMRRGFLVAAETAKERLARRLPLYRR